MSVLHAGVHFGEMALLGNAKRTATITAIEDCECFVLDKRTFAKSFGNLHDIMAREARETYIKVAPRADVEAAVFISAKADNFIAGADINMLREFKQQGREDELEQICMDGHDMFDEISRAGKPLVAAIHGSCLGGGLEWALKCDATRGRLASQLALHSASVCVMRATVDGRQRICDAPRANEGEIWG